MPQADRALLNALEHAAYAALGGRNWSDKLDEELLQNLGKYRKYNPTSLRDLLRVIRNKHNHFRELPEELQQRMGPIPEGFYR